MAIDPEALAASLRRLATLGEPGIGVVEALRHVTEACVGLFGVTGSGIMLADEQNVPRYVAASDGPGRMLEVVESDTPGKVPALRRSSTTLSSPAPT